MSTGRATLNELATVYSLRDCYDIMEVAVVDSRNQANYRVWQIRNNKP
jgi:hypothetical protein